MSLSGQTVVGPMWPRAVVTHCEGAFISEVRPFAFVFSSPLEFLLPSPGRVQFH